VYNFNYIKHELQSNNCLGYQVVQNPATKIIIVHIFSF